MDIISFNKAASVQKDLNNRVLTDVPENAVFTDTTYSNLSEFTNDVGYLTSYTETDPIYSAWDKSTGIIITESQISDFGSYEPSDSTILKDANIGVTIQAYNANTVIDPSYTHTDNNYTTIEKTKLSSIESGAQVNTVTSVAGKTGDIFLNKTDVNLGNVDNTADVDKPISIATQLVLDTKVDNSYLSSQLTDITNNVSINTGSITQSNLAILAIEEELNTLFPVVSLGDEGKMLVVKEDLSGYKVVASTSSSISTAKLMTMGVI